MKAAKRQADPWSLWEFFEQFPTRRKGAALQGLISMGFRLNDEADRIGAVKDRNGALVVQPAPQVVRSAWMG